MAKNIEVYSKRDSGYEILYPKADLNNSINKLLATRVSPGIFPSGDFTINGNLTVSSTLRFDINNSVRMQRDSYGHLQVTASNGVNFTVSDKSNFTINGSAINTDSSGLIIDSGYRRGTGTTSTYRINTSAYAFEMFFITGPGYNQTNVFSGAIIGDDGLYVKGQSAATPQMRVKIVSWSLEYIELGLYAQSDDAYIMMNGSTELYYYAFLGWKNS